MSAACTPMAAVQTVLTSRHALALTAGTDTHDPALRLIGQLVRLGQDEAFIVRVVTSLLPGEYDGNSLDELPGMIRDAVKKGWNAEPGAGDDDKQRREKVSAEALKLTAAQGMFLFHSDLGEPFAEFILPGGARRCSPVASEVTSGMIQRAYYHGKGKPLSETSLKEVLATMAAQARFDGPMVPVHVRLGGGYDRFFVDLGNATGDVVAITTEGWRITTDCPVKFYRPPGMAELPLPATGGSLRDLRDLLGLSDRNWTCVLAFLMTCLRPVGPYMILLVEGEQGSGKTFLCAIIKAILDPNAVPKLRLPKTEHDLMIQASGNALLLFDNTSGMRWDMSDAICSLVTGSGFNTRKYFTDNEARTFRFARPVVINGIGEFADRPDLLERAIRAELKSMPTGTRKTEREMLERFEEILPGILGRLFDIAATALRRWDEVTPPTSLRMADAAQWLVAAEPETGLPEGAILRALTEGQQELMMEKAMHAPLVIAIATHMVARQKVYGESAFDGTVGELFSELIKVHDHDRTFPATPAHLSTQLKRLAPAMLQLGMHVEFGERSKRGRPIRIWADGEVPLVDPDTVSQHF